MGDPKGFMKYAREGPKRKAAAFWESMGGEGERLCIRPDQPVHGHAGGMQRGDQSVVDQIVALEGRQSDLPGVPEPQSSHAFLPLVSRYRAA